MRVTLVVHLDGQSKNKDSILEAAARGVRRFVKETRYRNFSTSFLVTDNLALANRMIEEDDSVVLISSQKWRGVKNGIAVVRPRDTKGIINTIGDRLLEEEK